MMTLGLFARYPEPGKTKTRLAQALGGGVAADFSEAFLLDLLDRLSRQSDRFIVCATPDSPESRDWFQGQIPMKAELRFQPDGSLGDRIDWFFQMARPCVTRPAVLVGSDSPDLPTSVVTTAADRLLEKDVVFCPATDGGYTLVGMTGYHPGLFHQVSFSTPLTLNQSIECVQTAGLRCDLIHPWYDIDTVEDLCLLWSRVQMHAEVRESCPRTSRVLQARWPKINKFLS